jgi:hypothetical protein
MANGRVMTALLELLEFSRSASRPDRTNLAADFVREAVSAAMVALVVDPNTEPVGVISISSESSTFVESWPKLIEEELQVVRATGVRREVTLPNGYRAVCLREMGSGLTVTVCCVLGRDVPVTVEFVAKCRLVLRVVLSGWHLEDERRELRNDNIRLTHALESRVVIEQAKGVLVERWSVDPAEAFARLRQSARSNGTALSSTAEEIVRSSKEARQSR